MRVCITGGTGSLGQALVADFLEDPHIETVIALSRDEVKQGELAERFPSEKLRCFLGDVRDRDRLVTAFARCDAVIHAAALKRITQSVYSPSEIRKTNVDGTANVVAAAAQQRVRKVVVISSDKACQATNLYGASKFMAEQEAIQSNSYTYPHGTEVLAVRYGNVWGSRGSVVEVWNTAPWPLPLTDPRMTRFVITLAQAVALVRLALTRGQGGEVWVPKLPCMRLRDLAGVMSDVLPVVVGLRPGGEKLHEQLLSEEETMRVVELRDGYIIIPSHCTWRTPDWVATPQSPGFVYRSDGGPFLTPSELRAFWADPGRLV